MAGVISGGMQDAECRVLAWEGEAMLWIRQLWAKG